MLGLSIETHLPLIIIKSWNISGGDDRVNETLKGE